jgi:hypothetical protein
VRVTVGIADSLVIACENRGGEEVNEGDIRGNEGIPGKIFPVRGVGETVCGVGHAVDTSNYTRRNGEREGMGSECEAWWWWWW